MSCWQYGEEESKKTDRMRIRMIAVVVIHVAAAAKTIITIAK